MFRDFDEPARPLSTSSLTQLDGRQDVGMMVLILFITTGEGYKDLATQQLVRLSRPSALITTNDAAAVGDIAGGLAGNIYLATHGPFKKSTRDKNRR